MEYTCGAVAANSMQGHGKGTVAPQPGGKGRSWHPAAMRVRVIERKGPEDFIETIN